MLIVQPKDPIDSIISLINIMSSKCNNMELRVLGYFFDSIWMERRSISNETVYIYLDNKSVLEAYHATPLVTRQIETLSLKLRANTVTSVSGIVGPILHRMPVNLV